MNKINKELENDLSQRNQELREVNQFMKDRKNMSASLISAQNKNKLYLDDIKRLEKTVQILKNDENANPNALDVVSWEAFLKEQKINERLTDDVHHLKDQIKILETQVKETDHLKSAYNSDKQAFNQAMTGMKEKQDIRLVEYDKS